LSLEPPSLALGKNPVDSVRAVRRDAGQLHADDPHHLGPM
jgi:hypothetical protein